MLRLMLILLSVSYCFLAIGAEPVSSPTEVHYVYSDTTRMITASSPDAVHYVYSDTAQLTAIKRNTELTASNTVEKWYDYSIVLALLALIVAVTTLVFTIKTTRSQKMTERNTRRWTTESERENLREVIRHLSLDYAYLSIMEKELKNGLIIDKSSLRVLNIDVELLHAFDAIDAKYDHLLMDKARFLVLQLNKRLTDLVDSYKKNGLVNIEHNYTDCKDMIVALVICLTDLHNTIHNRRERCRFKKMAKVDSVGTESCLKEEVFEEDLDLRSYPCYDKYADANLNFVFQKYFLLIKSFLENPRSDDNDTSFGDFNEFLDKLTITDWKKQLENIRTTIDDNKYYSFFYGVNTDKTTKRRGIIYELTHKWNNLRERRRGMDTCKSHARIIGNTVVKQDLIDYFKAIISSIWIWPDLYNTDLSFAKKEFFSGENGGTLYIKAKDFGEYINCLSGNGITKSLLFLQYVDLSKWEDAKTIVRKLLYTNDSTWIVYESRKVKDIFSVKYVVISCYVDEFLYEATFSTNTDIYVDTNRVGDIKEMLKDGIEDEDEVINQLCKCIKIIYQINKLIEKNRILCKC